MFLYLFRAQYINFSKTFFDRNRYKHCQIIVHRIWKSHKILSKSKIHEIIFGVSCFLAKHKILGYLSEEEGESKNHSINKQLCQYQSVRDEGEKLRLVITNEELLSTADIHLADVKPTSKCNSSKVYLRKGLCTQGHKKVK